MGFHLEEEFIHDGIIDNRVKGRTILRFNFVNHTSSLVTLQGNPCRDLAGSLWSFKNPHARMEDEPGEQCFFIPAICEGAVGRISYSTKRHVPILPPAEHYERLFDGEEEPPTKIGPVLELEWFSQKFKQVEIACEQFNLELIEIAWSLSEEEAVEGEAIVQESRMQTIHSFGDSEDSFDDYIGLVEEFVADDPEPHELEELCFLIVQDYVIHSADRSEEKQELHSDLLKLQEQIAGAFVHHNDDGQFDDIPATLGLLTALVPFIDRATASAQYLASSTHDHLLDLKNGIIALCNELSNPDSE